MTLRTVIGAIVAILVAQFPGVSLAAADDPWTDANGKAEATRTIVSCLTNVSSSELQHAKDRCIGAPLDVCADRHARNEMTLGECARFTGEAWGDRLQQQIGRMRAATGPLARDFEDSQGRWRAWTEKDCAFQAAPAEGGSMYGELLSACVFTHAAQRALELEALADEWEIHPPNLPSGR